MTRDDEFAALAAQYAEADDDVIEAERQANQMRIALDAARKDRDGLKKKLAGLVGANVRTRNAVVGMRLVRAEYHGGASGDHVAVSVEDVTVTGVAVTEGSP